MFDLFLFFTFASFLYFAFMIQKLELFVASSISELSLASANLGKGRGLFWADTVFLAAEAKNLVATNKSLLKLASWFDWWLVAVRTYADSSLPENVAKAHYLLVARAELCLTWSRQQQQFGQNCSQEMRCHVIQAFQGLVSGGLLQDPKQTGLHCYWTTPHRHHHHSLELRLSLNQVTVKFSVTLRSTAPVSKGWGFWRGI